MSGIDMRGPLDVFKGSFHRSSQEAIARLSNVRWRLEVLQRRSGEILPGRDAVSFQAAIRPILQSLDDAKDLLLDADGKADGITAISRGDSSRE